MALLTGMTEDGQEVPVQVKPDGRLVAEGLQGPPGRDGAPPPGSVLQVVNATFNQQVVSTDKAWAFTGLTATITPASANSKVLVFANQVGLYKDTGDTAIQLRLVRGAAPILYFESAAGGTASTDVAAVGSSSTTFLDTPNTQSPVTYKTEFRGSAVGNRVIVQFFLDTVLPHSSITLMEIAG